MLVAIPAEGKGDSNVKYYKLHLIRHGLTAGNLQGLYIGSGTDLPLCDEGRAQLEELKHRFTYPDVPLVFTSPHAAGHPDGGAALSRGAADRAAGPAGDGLRQV